MLTRQMDRQKEKNFYDLLLGEETGRYVYRMLALKQIMEEPHLYDFYVDHLYPVEPTTQVYSMAPAFCRVLSVFASEDAFCPMET